MYKTLHGMTPDYLRSRFVYRDIVSAYRLRNTGNKLVLLRPRTDYLKRSLIFVQRSSVVKQLTYRPKKSIFTDRLTQFNTVESNILILSKFLDTAPMKRRFFNLNLLLLNCIVVR